MVSKEREAEVEGGWSGAQGGVGYGSGQSASRVALDLNMMTYRSQVYITGVNSSNSMFIRKTDFGWNVFASYMDFGVSFDSDVTENQGLQAALRPALELGLIELLGKYFIVPYWKCIPGAKKDVRMIHQIKTEFAGYFPEQKNLIIKKLLFLHGYKGLSMDTGTLNNEETKVFDKS